jgi:hypothetical protein
MTYDLNDTTRYTVWACSPAGEDLVYATDLTLWDAEFVRNEMNSIDSTYDYRVAAYDGAELYHRHFTTETGMTPSEEYEDVQEALAKEFSDNLHRFETGTF